MKKLISLVLAVMLLCSCAFAEEGKPFTFAEGAYMGMSIVDMFNIEGTKYSNHFSNGPLMEEYDYTGRQVSRYTATRAYMFNDDELVILEYYDFSENNSKDYKYLKTALESVYGEYANLSADEINSFMSAIGSEIRISIPIAVEWKVNGELKIWLISNMNSMYLFYISDDFDPEMAAEIDTTNL